MKRRIEQKSEELLSSSNLYKTTSRLSVLDILLNAGKPLTQNQITQKLGKGRFDNVTIYRTLESFCEAGLVHKVFLQKKASYFELAHNCTAEQCHPHFICASCGDTHCLTEMPALMTKLMPKGFVIQHQQVQLEGLCPKCGPK